MQTQNRYFLYKLKSGEELNLESISKSEQETLQIMLEDWQKHPYLNGEEFTSYWNSFVETAYKRAGKSNSPLTKITEDLADRIKEKKDLQELRFVLYSKKEEPKSIGW